MKRHQSTAKAFLELPAEALPSVVVVDEELENAGWRAVRYIAEHGTVGASIKVILTAARDEWRGGVTLWVGADAFFN